MDSIQFLNLRKQLKKGQSLVLDFDGTIKITEFNSITGKKMKKFMGKLEDFDEAIIPINSKLWATPPIPGKKSFYKFGDPLTKRDNNDLEVKILTGIVITFKDRAIKSTWIDTIHKFTYDVITWNNISIYFYSGVPRFIENNGNRIYIIQHLPELKFEIFNNLQYSK